jgi:hypothetical protein
MLLLIDSISVRSFQLVFEGYTGFIYLYLHLL